MRIGSSLIALAIVASATASASAAVIQLTGGDAGEGLALNPANVVYALDINGNNGATGYTVQGVTFLPSYPQVNTVNGGDFAVGATSFPGTSASDLALAEVFSTLNYATGDAGNDATITTTAGGLTPGASYQVNILVSLGDFPEIGRNDEFLLNGVLTGDTIFYAPGEYYNISCVGAANASGQLIIGVHDNTPGGGGGALVSGIVISAVPEPTSLGLLGLGVLALVRRRRA